jgi:hypothetical protein
VLKDLHDLAETRSLALHRVIAKRLASDPSLINRARQRVDHWASLGQLHPEYAEQWRTLLDGSMEDLAAAMTEPGDRGRALRHTTPFTFVVTPEQRWEIWRQSREQWEDDR